MIKHLMIVLNSKLRKLYSSKNKHNYLTIRCLLLFEPKKVTKIGY
jgi:hypothetical protein